MAVLPSPDFTVIILIILPSWSQKKNHFMSSLVKNLAAVSSKARVVLSESRLTFVCLLFWALVSIALLHLLKHDLCHDVLWDLRISSILFPSSKWDKGSWIGNWPTSVNFGRLWANVFFSKIQLVVYYQCCVLIGWATTRLYVIAH